MSFAGILEATSALMFEAPELASGQELPSPHDRCWFVYLLPLTDCTAFKVGFSCNPLQRIYGFSRRYFERFDLHQSLLLRVAECEQARSIEALLKAELVAFRNDAPRWLPKAAGGHTEWFSAVHFVHAQATLQAALADQHSAQVLPAFEQIDAELRRRCTDFESWAWRLAQQVCDARALYGTGCGVLRDWIDAYRFFGIPVFADDAAVREFVLATTR